MFTCFASTMSRPLFLFGQSQHPKFSLNNTHLEAASTAKNLALGRKVVLTILYPDGSLGNVKPAGDLFTQMTGIGIHYKKASLDEINTKIILSTMAPKEDFDLALPATFGLPDLIEANALENLDQFAKKYEPLDFQKDALYSIGDYYKGSLYGYQTDGDTYLMFYNKEWMKKENEQKRFFEQTGNLLKIPQTWEELDRMIAFFHRPENGMYGGSLFRTQNYIAWEWWMRFHSKGYFPLDDELNPQINNDAGVKALEELISVSNFLEPNVRVNGLFANFKSFSQGNKFCNIGWGGTQKYLNGKDSKIKGKLLYSPAPGGIIKGRLLPVPFFNWGWNYTVSAKSKEKEIAYLFALFACSPHVSIIAVREESGYFDPFRNSHYEDQQIIHTYTKEFLVAHKESMINSIPDFYLKGQGEYFDALRENTFMAYQGKLDPRQALDLTAMQWKRTTRKMGFQIQHEQWRFLKSLYPSKVRDLLS